MNWAFTSTEPFGLIVAGVTLARVVKLGVGGGAVGVGVGLLFAFALAAG